MPRTTSPSPSPLTPKPANNQPKIKSVLGGRSPTIKVLLKPSRTSAILTPGGHLPVVFLVVFFGVHLPPDVVLLDEREDARHPAEHPILLRPHRTRGAVPRHVVEAGRKGAELIVVMVQRQADLFEVIGAFDPVGRG